MVKLVVWPQKWSTVLFGGIERGDIKCSRILLFMYHCIILLTLVKFLPNSTAVNDQIVHFYDKSLKICRITNIAEIIISRYGRCHGINLGRCHGI